MKVHVKNFVGTWDPETKLRLQGEKRFETLHLPCGGEVVTNLSSTYVEREGAQWTEVDLQLNLQTEEVLTFLIGQAYHEGYCHGIQG